jgi:hypothetical protein
MNCLRAGCDHAIGRHEASGPCLADGCDCTGFKGALSAAERRAAAAAALTRCSGCGRRPQREGVGWVNHSGACSRRGREPDMREDSRGR